MTRDDVDHLESVAREARALDEKAEIERFARRLHAACSAHALGLKCMDPILKRYEKMPVGPAWLELAPVVLEWWREVQRSGFEKAIRRPTLEIVR